MGHKALLHGYRAGDRVLIGLGAIVLDSGIIEIDTFIAARSMV